MFFFHKTSRSPNKSGNEVQEENRDQHNRTGAQNMREKGWMHRINSIRPICIRLQSFSYSLFVFPLKYSYTCFQVSCNLLFIQHLCEKVPHVESFVARTLKQQMIISFFFSKQNSRRLFYLTKLNMIVELMEYLKHNNQSLFKFLKGDFYLKVITHPLFLINFPDKMGIWKIRPINLALQFMRLKLSKRRTPSACVSLYFVQLENLSPLIFFFLLQDIYYIKVV